MSKLMTIRLNCGKAKAPEPQPLAHIIVDYQPCADGEDQRDLRNYAEIVKWAHLAVAELIRFTGYRQ